MLTRPLATPNCAHSKRPCTPRNRIFDSSCGRVPLLAELGRCCVISNSYVHDFRSSSIRSKYPPAEPGALGCEPLKAAKRGR